MARRFDGRDDASLQYTIRTEGSRKSNPVCTVTRKEKKKKLTCRLLQLGPRNADGLGYQDKTWGDQSLKEPVRAPRRGQCSRGLVMDRVL